MAGGWFISPLRRREELFLSHIRRGGSDRTEHLEFNMRRLRYAIRLTHSEDASLRQQYVLFGIPDGQYKKRPEDLEVFTSTWNFLTGRSDSSAELLHYVETQRKQKCKNWPTFNGTHKTAPSIAALMTTEQEGQLRRVWEAEVIPLRIGTDAASRDPLIIKAVEREFADATGRIIPGIILMAYVEARRKRGEWLALKRDAQGHVGFNDIEKIG
jgi:hypothetical protein